MIRKLFVLIAALGLLAGACGGGGDAGSCAGVADDAIDAVQSMVNELDSLSLDEMAAMEKPNERKPAEEDPAFMVDFEETMTELEGRADELGCSDAEMEELLKDRADSLTADGMFGELMIEELQNGNIFE